MEKNKRLIRADVYSLIPLIGAHISWRVATNYHGKRFTPIFSQGFQPQLDHLRKIAERITFMGRARKSRNTIHQGISYPGSAYIDVITSTKNRKLQIFHRISELYKEPNILIQGQLLQDKRKAPTVVLFHPNMGGAAGMSDTAKYYRRKGYNTLAVTLGGYPGSPGVTTSEKTMIQDIEAVKQYLSDLGVKQVAYHGFSIGTSAALQAAEGESNVKDLETLFVALDQPFTSIVDIGKQVAGTVGHGVMTAACPVGLDVDLPRGLWTKTDGLNNLRKVKLLKEHDIPLFCFENEQDSLMGRKKVQNKYTENFARDLLAARYDDASIRARNLVTLSGSHGANCLRRVKEWGKDLLPTQTVEKFQKFRHGSNEGNTLRPFASKRPQSVTSFDLDIF